MPNGAVRSVAMDRAMMNTLRTVRTTFFRLVNQTVMFATISS